MLNIKINIHPLIKGYICISSSTYVMIFMVIIVEVKHGRGYVYALQYHLVWCVKYRRKILNGEIDTDLIKILYEIAEDNGINIVECNTDRDHVHLLIECSPQHFIPDMVKALKGVSARRIMQKRRNELSKVLYGGHLWNPSYFIATVSENTEDQIRRYIQNQKEK